MAGPAPRATTALVTILVLGGAGAACWFGARAAASFIETRSFQDVSLALRTAGHDWASVDTDGLQVQLTGTAPDEVQRFRAMTQAATAVDSSRIVDRMTVASREAAAPPDFEIELLRNDEGISLIGLVPASTDRGGIVTLLERETVAPLVTDLLETADYPVPDGWDAALAYGLRIAQAAPRAKISIGAGKVSVDAITDSVAEKGRLETELHRSRPEDVELDMDISAPRPVIAPFTMRLVIDESGTHFDACSADGEAAQSRIVEAAVKAGVTGTAVCTIGMGSPSPRWGDAAVAAIEALAALGAGTITISDADVSLNVPSSIAAARLDEAAGRLERELPPVFSLMATREQPVDTQAGPAEFSATVANDNSISLRGRITDERMRDAVESLARSRFAALDSSLRSDDSVPGGWTLRVIAALEAVAVLKSGTVQVTPDLLRISGTSGDPRASDRVAGILSDRLGAGAQYALSIRYDRRLDPALGLPDGAECVARMNRVMSESAIGFEPNKSVIAGEPEPTLVLLAEAMKDCGDFQIEAGGHTDSQGSDGFNADLSRARAQALVTAMTEAGIDTGNLTARGYGESQPIASNETEEGREANRRITFTLMSELPVREGALPEPTEVSGVTVDPAAAAAAAATAEAQGQIATEETRPQGGGADSANDDPAAPAPENAEPAAQTPDDGTDDTPAEDATNDAAAPDDALRTTAPAMIGVSESVPPANSGLDAEDDGVRLPVRTPDADTPRPAPRPGDAEDSSTGATE